MYRPNRRTVLAHSVAALAVTGLGRAFAGTKPRIQTGHHVAIRAFRFDPETLAVRIGDTVTWTNIDLVPHTATANTDAWGTDALDQSGFGSITVTEAMQGEYYCLYHPHMKGMLNIVS